MDVSYRAVPMGGHLLRAAAYFVGRSGAHLLGIASHGPAAVVITELLKTDRDRCCSN